MIQRTTLNEWAHVIKQKSWKFEDTLSLGQSNHLVCLLNSVFPFQIPLFQAQKDNKLPHGFHFLFNNQPNSKIGVDGYDDYQAPVDISSGIPLFRRRLWVKGKITYLNQPLIGTTSICRESISNVRSLGTSTFVSIQRHFEDVSQRPLFHEERTLVYTNEPFEAEQRQRADRSAVESDHSLSLHVSREQIMKFSHLTYNLHKIHLDESYCKSVENLPTIVVQGPFMVTLLLIWFRQLFPKLTVVTISYKNSEPCLVGERLKLVCIMTGPNQYQAGIVKDDDSKCYVQSQIETTI